MPIPFGFGVGDFLAVGKLITEITVELRENGEAAPDYQSLLIELEALGRALHQLETLKPVRHELLQLNAIRATAMMCRRPLQEFLSKISKFEDRLGTRGVLENRFRGLPRRMQWRLQYKADVKDLRSALGSHVSTINLLLMTQTVGSISAAEKDRQVAVSELGREILMHRRLLEDIKDGEEETASQLRIHKVVLEDIAGEVGSVNAGIQEQQASIRDLQANVSSNKRQLASILATATSIFSLAASGTMKLRLVAEQIKAMFELVSDFTIEMREAMRELVRLFTSLLASLRRLENSLPKRICAPIVQFTDALGEVFALPYQICQQWATFRMMLDVLFSNKPGKARVDMGKFLIMHASSGRLISEASWQNSIKIDDHISMSILLEDVWVPEGCCPFPNCQVPLGDIPVENGGQTCVVCGRWVSIIRKAHILRPSRSFRGYIWKELSGTEWIWTRIPLN